MAYHADSATCVAPRRLDVSGRFQRNYASAYYGLKQRVTALEKNKDVAREVAESGQQRIAERILRCGCQLAGDDPNSLRPTYYCKQPFFCQNCMILLAMNRKAQWMTACDLFSQVVDCEELVMNRFLLKPAALTLGSTPVEDLAITAKLIMEFKRKLKTYHYNHNVTRFLSGLLTGKTAHKQKETLCGPTRTAIHIAPSLASRASNQRSYMHLHITIVTPRQVRVRNLTTDLQKLWKETKSAIGVTYTTRTEELTRHGKSEEPSFDIEDLTERKYRPSHFPVTQKNHSATVLADRHMGYMSMPFKANWKPDALMQAHDIMLSSGMTHRSLSQSLGMMNVQRKQLPNEFNAERLNPLFVAEYIAGEWKITMREIRKSSPGLTPGQ